MTPTWDVVVIGAGIVGAAVAHACADSGLSVAVVDRGGAVGRTTGSGEGNLLVSDKEPGPELDLAVASLARWGELATELGPVIEWEAKGGLVVARSDEALDGARALADAQRPHGVSAEVVAADELTHLEAHLHPDLVGGVAYPQDAQVQPMLATAHLLATVRRRGGSVRAQTVVTGLRRHGDRVVGIDTDRGAFGAGAVVNAAGTWGGEIAAMAGVSVPIEPRRGAILVTEALAPGTITRKVYGADYVGAVTSTSSGLETSPVVEQTVSGTVLVGSSRERVGFDRTPSPDVWARMAAQAVALFPFLADVAVLRTYQGFRPWCADGLPVIGPDPRAPGLIHACGHEGSGIGLAPATGQLVAQLISGAAPICDPTPFRPERFAEAA